MGKTRRQKKKLHLSRNTDSDLSDSDIISQSSTRTSNISAKGGSLSYPKRWKEPTQCEAITSTSSLAPLHLTNDSFQWSIVSKVPTVKPNSKGDDDAWTTISSSKSVFKNRGANKKERRKLRHQTFIEKINAIQTMKKTKQNKNRNEDSLLKEEPHTSGTNTTIFLPQDNVKSVAMRKTGKTNSQARHTRMLKDIAVLKKLWEKPEYKADPSGFVSEVVQERLAKENE